MNCRSYYVILYLFYLSSLAFPDGENIGFCLDVKGKVQRSGKIRNGILRKGDLIYNGDKIITGSHGFVSYAFIYILITLNFTYLIYKVFEIIL